jgi:hypothetical protein
VVFWSFAAATLVEDVCVVGAPVHLVAAGSPVSHLLVPTQVMLPHMHVFAFSKPAFSTQS